MLIIDVDIRIVPFNLLQDPEPEIGLVDKDVGFCAECQELFLITVLAVFKSIANTSFDALACIDRLLNGDFIRRALF
jgi:hypothetical protein